MANPITFGSEYVFKTSTCNYIDTIYLDSTHFVVIYVQNSLGYSIIGTITGTTISYGNVVNFCDLYASDQISVTVLDSTHFAVAFIESSTGYIGTVSIGTVSGGNVITYGNKYNFNAASTGYLSISKLTTNNFVVTYNNSANGYAYSIIGSVSSGNVITFGSEYIYNSQANFVTVKAVTALDSTNFIITYRGANGGINAIAGIVSGTTISYGSATAVQTGSIPSITALDSTRFVISYKTTSGANAVVGTLAGTAISFGTKYTFSTSSITVIDIYSFDSSKFVIAFQDSTSVIGKALIATVTATDISFDTSYNFNAGDNAYIAVTTLSSSSFSISYSDVINSNYGTSIIGTIPILGKKINGITYAKWNGLSVGKLNGI